MEVNLEIQPYSREHGIRLTWYPDFEITCKEDHGAILIQANADGLKSLANLCLTLAQDTAPIHSHVHLDEYNSLEDGSMELIISKV